MSAAFLTGAGTPFDPFQSKGAPHKGASDPAQALLTRWLVNMVQQHDQSTSLPDEWAEEERQDRLWDERDEIEKAALILPDTLASIILKLRIAAWAMEVENTDCAGRDGVRTNAPSAEEVAIASAIAFLDALAGRAQP